MCTRLRIATSRDCDKTFEWRNDPWIVSLSASQKRVERKEHESWFQEILNSSASTLHVICDDSGGDMGTVRVDVLRTETAVITVYLLRQFTGKSHGVAAVRQASDLAFDRWPRVAAIHASIRNDNAPSVSAFTKAGYRLCSPDGRIDRAENLCEMRLVRADANPQ